MLEFGRQGGLRIHWPLGRVGSSPTVATNLNRIQIMDKSRITDFNSRLGDYRVYDHDPAKKLNNLGSDLNCEFDNCYDLIESNKRYIESMNGGLGYILLDSVEIEVLLKVGETFPHNSEYEKRYGELFDRFGKDLIEQKLTWMYENGLISGWAASNDESAKNSKIINAELTLMGKHFYEFHSKNLIYRFLIKNETIVSTLIGFIIGWLTQFPWVLWLNLFIDWIN